MTLMADLTHDGLSLVMINCTRISAPSRRLGHCVQAAAAAVADDDEDA